MTTSSTANLTRKETTDLLFSNLHNLAKKSDLKVASISDSVVYVVLHSFQQNSHEVVQARIDELSLQVLADMEAIKFDGYERVSLDIDTAGDKQILVKGL